jgi:nitrous oxide reductase accessory protein NosL
MNRLSAATVAALLALSGVARADHHLADTKEAPSCRYCGMDRAKFASSRMVVRYDDGTSVGTCSLHCTAVELANQIDKTPAAIQVADFATQALVDAEKAAWVLGGSKPGVMTKRAKWAFGDRAAADAFVKENGGTVVSFEEAVKAAYEDLYQDNKMIREKRKAMKAGKQAPSAGKQPAAVEKPAEHSAH